MPVDFPDDCQRLVAAAATRGITITPEQAEDIWIVHSNEFFCSWENLDGHSDEQLADIVAEAQ